MMFFLQGQRSINAKDSACFWWSLYIQVSQQLSTGLDVCWHSQGLLMFAHGLRIYTTNALTPPGLEAMLEACRPLQTHHNCSSAIFLSQ